MYSRAHCVEHLAQQLTQEGVDIRSVALVSVLIASIYELSIYFKRLDL